MKKIFSIVAVAAMMLFVGKANAQLTFNLGYAPQNYVTDNNGNESTVSLNGLFAGLSKNINLSGDLNVSVGADVRFNFKSESATAGTTGVGASSTKTTSQLLIDVPVLFNYGLKLNSDITISAFAGPTFSYAIFGKDKYEGNASAWGVSVGSNNEVDWYDNTGRGKFDVAVTFGLKLGFQKYSFFGGYNLGLLNLTDQDNVTLKGNNWFVGFGYAL